MCDCIFPDSYDYTCGDFGCLDFELGYNDSTHWKGIDMKLLHPSLIITAKGCEDTRSEAVFDERDAALISRARWGVDRWDAMIARKVDKLAGRSAARPAHGETDGTVRFNRDYVQAVKL